MSEMTKVSSGYRDEIIYWVTRGCLSSSGHELKIMRSHFLI